MTKRYILLFFSLFFFPTLFVHAQSNFCGIHNTAFYPGEEITYKVYYSLGKLYVAAGEAKFTVSLEKYNGTPAYHVVGEGTTYKTYDWFFKVHDRYESYIDTSNMLPLKFIRNVNEDGYRKYNNVTFNQGMHSAVSTNGVFQVPACVQDVISAIYYARNIDFDNYKPEDKIPFTMFLDDKVYHLYIRYMGKEKVSTRFGTFNAIKFKPLLIKGTIFKGGEQMTVWVTDDKNHIPLRIMSPISVGDVKVDMVKFKGVRYPVSSFVSKDKG